MQFLEKELEDFLFSFLESNNLEELDNRGLWIDTTENMDFERQMDLAPYGIADIVGHDIYCVDDVLFANVFIFELKKDTVNFHTLGQSCRYLTAFNELLNKKALELNVEIETNYKVYLIGTKLEENDFCFLPTLIDQVNIHLAKFCPLNGIKFEERTGYYKSGDFSYRLQDMYNDIENYKI